MLEVLLLLDDLLLLLLPATISPLQLWHTDKVPSPVEAAALAFFCAAMASCSANIFKRSSEKK